jgi:hypothetical protein
MFHLLTMFPNNAAEQERYYITNVLKKPQCISIRRFVQRVEQINSYISQLPCRYYSPSAKAGTIPMNVAFPEADLASHVLRMCPHMWQDQFNLHKKGLNHMCARNMGAHIPAYTTHNTQDCRRYEKSGNKKSDFRATKKGTKKPDPTK